MSRSNQVRIGKVTMYLRSKVWYLRYHEQGRRRQVRASSDLAATRQLASQVNAQLEVGAPAATSFDPVSVPELRRRWLEHHEHVRRSSISTVARYRTATDHLLRFVNKVMPVKHASHFRGPQAEAFVRHLRELKVAPNGHTNTTKRNLRDKGLKFVLETCRSMFNFAIKRRHLPPYADNPFTLIEIDRIPIEDAKPVIVFDGKQEEQLLQACDDWQFPIMLTLALTGLRLGELIHLLLPEDVDLTEGWLMVRNKPELGWQTKTRNERRVPLLPELTEVLRIATGERTSGPLFLRRRFTQGDLPSLHGLLRQELAETFSTRAGKMMSDQKELSSRAARQRCADPFWMDMGAIKSEVLRLEFMCLTAAIGLPMITAPKTLRHGFATCLQDANVDPLIRSELMGHSSAGSSKGPLGMTSVYTHTRDGTLRRQFHLAMANRSIVTLGRQWAQRQQSAMSLMSHSATVNVNDLVRTRQIEASNHAP